MVDRRWRSRESGRNYKSWQTESHRSRVVVTNVGSWVGWSETTKHRSMNRQLVSLGVHPDIRPFSSVEFCALYVIGEIESIFIPVRTSECASWGRSGREESRRSPVRRRAGHSAPVQLTRHSFPGSHGFCVISKHRLAIPPRERDRHSWYFSWRSTTTLCLRIHQFI